MDKLISKTFIYKTYSILASIITVLYENYRSIVRVPDVVSNGCKQFWGGNGIAAVCEDEGMEGE